MQRLLLTIAILAWLPFATTAPAGQGPAARKPLTQDQIVAVIGSATDAGRALWQVLSHALAHTQPPHHLLSSQIRAEWLPTIDGMPLVLLSDDDAMALAGACGTYWVIETIRREGDVVSLFLGRRCSGGTLAYIVSFDGQDWRLGPPGTGRDGGGFATGFGRGVYGGGPPLECRCDR